MLSGSDAQAVAAVRAAGEEFAVNAPEHRMSALQDLEAGRRLEVEETFGDMVRRARQRDVHVPLLEATYHLVAAIDRINSGSQPRSA
ncbi:protein containing Ketopantoate reductase ApbA/PanE [mine drainage metagenome]|uniref:Protein containing Ketopantoate reductase ApbA/PanE n=1 Tax=mine drainage metagenome TaxID=410659 RepID=T1B8J8_9ZZZZ